MNRMTEERKPGNQNGSANVRDQSLETKGKKQSSKNKFKITLLAQTHILPIYPVPAVRLRRTRIHELLFRSLYL